MRKKKNKPVQGESYRGEHGDRKEDEKSRVPESLIVRVLVVGVVEDDVVDVVIVGDGFSVIVLVAVSSAIVD